MPSLSRRLGILLALLSAALLLAEPAHAQAPAWTGRVLKLTVTRQDGAIEHGSAVPLTGDRMVTNCHVLRDAARIEVQVGDTLRRAQATLRDAYRDICLLSVPGYLGESTALVDLGQTRVGMDVVAVGYSGGRFGVSEGKIVGLHVCECGGGRVIQTSAPFDRGASGGGLFDRQGRLVGILTFKARSGGNFHFALPAGWLRLMSAWGGQPQGETSFWERPGKGSAFFLVACNLSAKEDWSALARLAGDWCGQEPRNPEAWMALGRAQHGLGKAEEAAQAFQQVLALDAGYDEARWRLGELEAELGRSLLPLGVR